VYCDVDSGNARLVRVRVNVVTSGHFTEQTTILRKVHTDQGNLRMLICWVAMPCGLVGRETNVSEEHNDYEADMKREAICSAETHVPVSPHEAATHKSNITN
jgi:hypothetical protein